MAVIMSVKRVVALTALVVLCERVAAVPVGTFFPYGEEYGDDSLPSRDEVSSAKIKLNVPVLFYGQTYDGAYANANGMVSFLTELPNFNNVPFPLNFPIIAPLYTDVDLSGTGSVFYRSTDQETLLKMFDARVARYFSGGSSFQAQELLIVTWDAVGHFNAAISKVNTFQLVLGWDGRETFSLFLYADDGVQWIAGDGKTAHQADARAQAGFISGDGRFSELPHSGTDQARHLDRLTNCDEAGVYIYRVGRIQQGQSVGTPDINVSEPAEELSAAPETCAAGGITCHSDATCHDHVNGFCCVCNAGLYGNGKSCLPTDQPLRIMGPLYGTLNGYTIEDQELQGYAFVADGRAYTSLAKIIPDIGYDLQSLMPVGDALAWMFAKPADGAQNGFQLTGGIANVTIDVDYPQTGDHVVMQQDFTGLGVFNHLGISTRLSGAVPAITLGSSIEMDDYINTVVSIGLGRVRISSQRQFRQGGNSLSIPMTMEAEVMFEECAGPPQRPELAQLRHIVDRCFIQYEEPEQIVRFASANAIETLSDKDPCKDATRKCGPNSVCTPDGPTGFRCDCRPGFVYDYREGPSDAEPEELRVCVDINECQLGIDSCHENALCSNEFGSYACICLPEYTGDGQQCEKLTTCADLSCGANAGCYEYSRGSPVCECDIGYIGDGINCEAVPQPTESLEGDRCESSSDCGLNAECRYSEWRRRSVCTCVPGYAARRGRCRPSGSAPGPCGDDFCHSHASCVEVEPGRPGCVCNPGFYGNGLECRTTDQTGNVCLSANDCGANAECMFASWAGGNVCVCKEGYFGDGMRCVQATPIAVLCGGIECHPAADCRDVQGVPQCVCNEGLEGDGYTVCKTQPVEMRCDTFADCGPNADCEYADWLGANVCLCRPGFFGDGVNCSVVTPVAVLCNGVECNSNAECLEYEVGNPQCICDVGFYGDGIECFATPEDPECDSGAGIDCGENAMCTFAPWVDRELCLCNPGFRRDAVAGCVPGEDPIPGTGGCLEDSDCPERQRCDYEVDTGLFVCMPVPTPPEPSAPEPVFPECSMADVCSPDGMCGFDVTTDMFVCTCQAGFTGDGYTCSPLPEPTSPEPTTEPPVEMTNVTEPPPVEEPVGLPLTVEPSCIFGFCVCPEEYQLSDDLEDCFLVLQAPLPACIEPGVCACPATYRYDAATDTCVTSGEGEYDTKGPSGPGPVPDEEPEGTPEPEVAVNASTVEVVPAEDLCRYDEDCPEGAACTYSIPNGVYQCSCFDGYTGDGSTCTPDPDADCSVLKDCHPEASCVYHQEEDKYHCQCRRGFDGDGKECVQVTLGCNILDNCGELADCLYVQEELRFRCKCRPGLAGDGYTCRPSLSCYDDPRQCDVNAACVPNLDGFRCVCLKNYIGDGKTCSPAPRHDSGFLLLNQGSAIVKVPFEARKRGRPILLQPTQTAVGIDTDCLEGRVFWTDVAGRKIKSSAYNGTQQVEFAMGDISSPEGVSVDFVSRNVYWTDSARDTIEVASIVTGNRFTLISTGLVNVRGVAVHPGYGTIFWADWNRRRPRIEQASMDGSDRHVLLNEGLGLPNSLAIDFDSEELCWTDAGTRTVECFSPRTRVRRVVVKDAGYPFGIAITEDNIYWTDWNDKKIHVVSKATGERGKSLRSVLGTSSKLYGLVATPRSCPQVTNACGTGNGGCSPDQLCLPTDRGSRQCICPDRFVAEPQEPSICRAA